MTGAAPVPVPPPRPVVTNTMSAPDSALISVVGVLERGLPADVRIGAGAEALGQLAADLNLHRRRAVPQRLRVGVGDDELDAAEAGLNHARDGVAAAAADADHLDARAGAGSFVDRQAQPLVVPSIAAGHVIVIQVRHRAPLPTQKNSLNTPRSRANHPRQRAAADPHPSGVRCRSA